MKELNKIIRDLQSLVSVLVSNGQTSSAGSLQVLINKLKKIAKNG